MIAQEIIGIPEREKIRRAVSDAELKTSGEIRVFVEDASADTELDRAVYVFEELGMHKTDLRNGILLYLALKDKRFAVIGDHGIHEKVGDAFWEGIRSHMQEKLSQGDVVGAIVAGVREAGEALGKFFPRSHDDKNELSDDIVFGGDK